MAESASKVWLYGQHGKLAYGIKQYIVDDESGISELPKDVHVGSSCFVIATGAIYVLNSEKKWIKAISGSSSSGEESGDTEPSGGSDDGTDPTPSDDEEDVTYDGGEVA